MPLRPPRRRARSIPFALALLLAFALAPGARAQSVLGYGEDATAAPSGAIRLRLSNDWHRSRAIGSANDSVYDTDRQYRATTIGLELGVLRRVTLGVNVPWVTTKALTFLSANHTHGPVLDTLFDSSHNGWGNIEAFAKVVWVGDPGQEGRLAMRDGVHVRSAIIGGALLGTGIFLDVSDPFAIGTSDRARALIARSATDITVGPHFFTSLVGRYERPKADFFTVAVRPADDPFTRFVQPFSAARKLGTKYEVEITPRWQMGRYFAVGVQYRYHHGAQDSYTGTLNTTVDGSPVTLDASALDAGTELTEHRGSFGVVYSSVDAYAHHQSRIPLEVTFEHSKVFSISGNRPKESQTMISVRIFHRVRGNAFRNAPPAPAPPPPASAPAP